MKSKQPPSRAFRNEPVIITKEEAVEYLSNLEDQDRVIKLTDGYECLGCEMMNEREAGNYFVQWNGGIARDFKAIGKMDADLSKYIMEICDSGLGAYHWTVRDILACLKESWDNDRINNLSRIYLDRAKRLKL